MVSRAATYEPALFQRVHITQDCSPLCPALFHLEMFELLLQSPRSSRPVALLHPPLLSASNSGLEDSSLLSAT